MTAREAVNLMQSRLHCTNFWVGQIQRKMEERMDEGVVFCETRGGPIIWVNDSYDTCVCSDLEPFLDPRDFDNDTAEAVVRQIETQGFHPGDLLAERFQETR